MVNLVFEHLQLSLIRGGEINYKTSKFCIGALLSGAFLSVHENKTRTSQVGATLKAQKAKTKNSHKVSKHQKGAFHARKTLQNFEYSVLGHTGTLFPILGLVLSRAQFYFDIT